MLNANLKPSPKPLRCSPSRLPCSRLSGGGEGGTGPGPTATDGGRTRVYPTQLCASDFTMPRIHGLNSRVRGSGYSSLQPLRLRAKCVPLSRQEPQRLEKAQFFELLVAKTFESTATLHGIRLHSHGRRPHSHGRRLESCTTPMEWKPQRLRAE